MKQIRRIAFVLFFVSGFCGLVYQTLWLRLAFSAFGVITPVVSVILSIFMLGLGIGASTGGRLVGTIDGRRGQSAIWYYASAEFMIGMGAFIVPRLFIWWQHQLLGSGGMDSQHYLLTSAIAITISLLPWCVCMGTTFPFMMGYIKRLTTTYQSSFSFLYVGNVLGAVTGVILAGVVLIESLGLSKTLFLAGTLNFVIALTSVGLGLATRSIQSPIGVEMAPQTPTLGTATMWESGSTVPLLLFMTGFCSMAMEVAWTRAFTPITATSIYAFVLLLATYLVATAGGSLVYRWHLRRAKTEFSLQLFAFLAVAAFLPLIVNEPRLNPTPLNIVLSLLPFCGGLGYLTPSLIDHSAGGEPERAGKLYAINILGSILGPLFAGYIVLPVAGVKWTLLLLAIPFAVLLIVKLVAFKTTATVKAIWMSVLAAVLVIALYSTTFEDPRLYGTGIVLRDHTATVIAAGQGTHKRLLVNGIGMTKLTPITKIMAHLPLASLFGQPRNMLIICFGMGTTFRSAMRWGIEVRSVELVPSVLRAFPYFFDDVPELLADSRGKIIIDDGRRYLMRTSERFDVIAVDPPPPVEAAGSSLLYSDEFYRLAQAHLSDGGILQQWFPGGEDKILYAISRTLSRSFPYIRAFHSVETYGYHFLASNKPIRVPDADAMLAKMPDRARQDLMEWYPGGECRQILADILCREVKIADISGPDHVFAITDDRPYNEYFLLRRTATGRQGSIKVIR